MRTPIIAGNWKMNKTVSEARELVSEMIPFLKDVQGVTTVLCPPASALLPIAAMLEGTDIGLGAQNMHWEANGAYTGELAPAMVSEFGQYVILGHSERREYFGETDETVNKKVHAAQANGLIPIVCVGETLEENEANQTSAIVSRQIQAGLAGVKSDLVIAYEPIWAIGTGRAATSEMANATIKIIREVLADIFGNEVAQGIRILYGGSVKGSNAAEYFAQSDIDGALIGGAALKADDFVKIVYVSRAEVMKGNS
ncbi:MAG: triose-phosphate isomerase [Anaerolineales bacterium]|uniref:Triosephosphate isomerase n=1 Tax=Candidatus Desulfolinea nitratireducens TaxID=2841698 RepID=A0A8J6NN19_9CHLR|nr:triose-phosphate isomerase [Candidatus Desulfolinea nitratireducens]MBL6961020.1 triose-phosphate isomerase [Anaerolineales bacterium]